MTRYTAENHPSQAIRLAYERKRLNGEAGNKPAQPKAKPRPVPPSWQKGMLRTQNGELRPVEFNVAHALRHHPKLARRLRFNILTEAVECAELPWRTCPDWRPWTDLDDAELAAWCQDIGMMAKPTTAATAAQMVAADTHYDPVRDYLDGLVWDGTPRLDGWLALYLGAKAEPGRERYLEQVGRKWPIQAVARVYEPGVKADCNLVIEGGQGTFKSSAVRTLAVREEWFADEIADLGSKDAAQDLRGKWIIEIAELSAMKRSEVERVKAFLSRKVDHYRPSYGRRSVDHPRRCVFAGTTNSDAYLGDETGGRRFWPVKAGKIDLDGLRRDRDQLWAEAVHAYKAGEAWWLDPKDERLAGEAQEKRRITDAWEEPLLAWAEGQGPFSMKDALCGAFNLPIDRHDQAAGHRVGRILKAAGFERFQKRIGPQLVWLYRRVSPDPSPVYPDDNNPTGYKKPSENNVVTSVTGSSDEKSTRSDGDTGGVNAAATGGAPHESGETGGYTGYTGYSVENAGPSVTSSPRVTGYRPASRTDYKPDQRHPDQDACLYCGSRVRPEDPEGVRLDDGSRAHGKCRARHGGALPYDGCSDIPDDEPAEFPQ